MNVWTDLFADKLDVDDREPLTTFQIPGVEGSFELFPPKAVFWIQLTVVRNAYSIRYLAFG
jgi:hypothetical protein